MIDWGRTVRGTENLAVVEGVSKRFGDDQSYFGLKVVGNLICSSFEREFSDYKPRSVRDSVSLTVMIRKVFAMLFPFPLLIKCSSCLVSPFFRLSRLNCFVTQLRVGRKLLGSRCVKERWLYRPRHLKVRITSIISALPKEVDEQLRAWLDHILIERV